MLGFDAGKEQETTGRLMFGSDELVQLEPGGGGRRFGGCCGGIHLLCSLPLFCYFLESTYFLIFQMP